MYEIWSNYNDNGLEFQFFFGMSVTFSNDFYSFFLKVVIK